jgi:hypothetical protein
MLCKVIDELQDREADRGMRKLFGALLNDERDIMHFRNPNLPGTAQPELIA